MSAEQATLDGYREGLARRSRDQGATVALWSAEEWATAARLVLEELIESGLPFTSEDVRLVTGPPPSPGAMGGLILAASKADRIRCVGYERSKRPARHSGLLRVFVGAGAAP